MHGLFLAALAAARPLTAARPPQLALRTCAPLTERSASRFVMADVSTMDTITQAPPAAWAAAIAGLSALASFPRRRIDFSEIDTARAVVYLQSFPTSAFNLWSDTEWQRLGVKSKLDFSTSCQAESNPGPLLLLPSTESNPGPLLLLPSTSPPASCRYLRSPKFDFRMYV